MSKGSNRRPEDAEAVAANWDDIDWGKEDSDGKRSNKEAKDENTSS